MRYTVSVSKVEVVGEIWMPSCTCAMEYVLDPYDVENLDKPVDRESVEEWLSTHAGDFREITDFRASIEVDGETVDIPWKTEEGECAYYDCMFHEED